MSKSFDLLTVEEEEVGKVSKYRKVNRKITCNEV